MSTNKLRKDFLSFFESKDHKVFGSDTLVPKDDSTLLFTSAGMNQFKDYFLGKRKGVTRACSCQKCLRTGDLEKVGKTPSHHTFFEMLGNFSFGDYFKEDAILWAWEFLTSELNLKEKDLWASVYEEDEEAFGVWRNKIGLPKEKIIRLGAYDNFWPANALDDGPDGPCGPCSEIFFDWGKDKGCKKPQCNPACSCGRFVEVWNLVFTQFNRTGFKKISPLPSKNIDTGMGLERLSSVLQGKLTNFEIDIMQPIASKVAGFVKEKNRALINAISDHIRAIVFAICDGVYPSNEARGYVVRRILRRALWHGFSLGRKKPYLYKLVVLVAELMRDPYPEVYKKKEAISSVILAEEERFLATIDKGRQVLFSYIDEARSAKKDILSAQEMFKLYDTYGFPYELTQNIAEDKGLKVDMENFKELLEKQRAASREKSKFDETVFVESKLYFKFPTEFVGYKEAKVDVTVKAIIKDNQVVNSYQGNQKLALVLDRTPFYPDSGGQLADKGTITATGFVFQVYNVLKLEDTILHLGVLTKGKITKDSQAKALIDKERREALARAHTATHLLQAALRNILGAHVQQQGSLVDEDYLRFDFNHFKRLDERQLSLIEKQVNIYILENLDVETMHLSFEEAKRKGALAFFEEKYEEEVRLVKIADISKELCAGTHLKKTSESLLFIIASESSVSSGVRRIEALVGKKAYGRALEARQKIKNISTLLKSQEENIEENVRALLTKNKECAKEINQMRRKNFEAVESKAILKKNSSKIGKLQMVVFKSRYDDPDLLRQYVDILKKKAAKNSVILGYILDNQKLTLNVSCSQDVVKKGFSCQEACLKIAQNFGGSGGGREDFGFAGAKNIKDLSVDKIKRVGTSIITQILSI